MGAPWGWLACGREVRDYLWPPSPNESASRSSVFITDNQRRVFSDATSDYVLVQPPFGDGDAARGLRA